MITMQTRVDAELLAVMQYADSLEIELEGLESPATIMRRVSALREELASVRQRIAELEASA